jgi:hypothetical protein
LAPLSGQNLRATLVTCRSARPAHVTSIAPHPQHDGCLLVLWQELEGCGSPVQPYHLQEMRSSRPSSATAGTGHRAPVRLNLSMLANEYYATSTAATPAGFQAMTSRFVLAGAMDAPIALIFARYYISVIHQ